VIDCPEFEDVCCVGVLRENQAVGGEEVVYNGYRTVFRVLYLSLFDLIE